MKGMVLAGGAGTRLYPITRAVSKHLLPVYDKPMIYYPLSVLMLAGIREVLVISTPEDLPRFRYLLGDGSQLGMQFQFAEQPVANGVAQAFAIGRTFIGSDSVGLILGDNIFYGSGLGPLVKKAASSVSGATIFGYSVTDPERYGVAVFDKGNQVIDLVEKPVRPPSNVAITGLYFYSNDVLDVAASLKPSDRGEYEITDINREYLRQGRLQFMRFGRGMAWLDTGTPDALLDASKFIEVVETRQGLKIGCIEEIAFRNGFIDGEQLARLIEPLRKTPYGMYLERMMRETPEFRTV